MITKERILKASVKLFNRFGVNRVSLRQIGNEIGISHGNLTYHFKNQAVIVNEVYSRMEGEMSDAVFPEGDHTLAHFNELFHKISAFQKKYEFFYRDLLEITRDYPKVIRRYRQTIIHRRNDYDGLIRHYIRKGLMKTERENGFYQSIFHSIWVMSTFWLQHKIILGKDHPFIATGDGIKHVWEIMLPHLTEKGLIEYRTFIEKDVSARPIQNLYLNQIN